MSHIVKNERTRNENSLQTGKIQMRWFMMSYLILIYTVTCWSLNSQHNIFLTEHFFFFCNFEDENLL